MVALKEDLWIISVVMDAGNKSYVEVGNLLC